MITTFQFDKHNERLICDSTAPTACPAEEAGIIWVDLLKPTPDEVEQVLRLAFGIHPLAIEDALADGHPPKLEDHGGYLQIILHAIRPDTRRAATVTSAFDETAVAPLLAERRATGNGTTNGAASEAGNGGVRSDAAANKAAARDAARRRRSDRQRSSGRASGAPSRRDRQTDPTAMPALFFTAELTAFIGPNFLITVHNAPIDSLDTVQTRLKANPGAIQKGPDFLFHKIIDDLIDHYFPVLDSLTDGIEATEDEVFTCPTATTLPTILRLKRDVNRLRRIAVQEREVLHLLSRGDAELITADEQVYYRDVYDHLVRIADLTESYREQLGGVLDAYLSVNANRTNDVMKVLTIIATIFIPLTFIAGVYGMNFDDMPELHWKHGYAATWVLMILTASAFLVYFRRKEWI